MDAPRRRPEPLEQLRRGIPAAVAGLAQEARQPVSPGGRPRPAWDALQEREGSPSRRRRTSPLPASFASRQALMAWSSRHDGCPPPAAGPPAAVRSLDATGRRRGHGGQRCTSRSKPTAVCSMAKRSTTGRPRPPRDGVRSHRPVDADEHHDLLVWQHESDPEDHSRVVTDWRSMARPSVAGRLSSADRGRRCHPGPRRATTPGRLPDPLRTTSPQVGIASARVVQ